MRVLRLLRKPVPRALFAGQLLSVTGDKLYAMAVLWLVLQLTHSAQLMAAVSLAESVPYVAVGLLCAGLVRREARLRALIRIDLLSAAVIAAVPIAFLAGLRSVALLIGVAAMASALEAVFDPSLQAVLPDMVAGDDVQAMIALTDSTDRLARVIGPGCAGLLLLIVPEIHLFTVDAATFVVSAGALCYAAARVPARVEPTAPQRARRWDLLEGMREVAARRTLRVGLAVRGLCNVAWSAFTIGVPFELERTLHAGLASYGLLLGAFGVGNVVGNVLSGGRRVGDHLLGTYCLSWALVGVGLVGLGCSRSLPLAVIATVWTGVFTPLANVSLDTHIAMVVPRDALVKVYALERVTVVAASALGVYAVATGIELSSGATVVAAAGGWMALVGLVALARLSRSPRPPSLGDGDGRS